MQLDILEDYLNLRGLKYSRLDGSTNRVQRMIDIKVRASYESVVLLSWVHVHRSPAASTHLLHPV